MLTISIITIIIISIFIYIAAPSSAEEEDFILDLQELQTIETTPDLQALEELIQPYEKPSSEYGACLCKQNLWTCTN